MCVCVCLKKKSDSSFIKLKKKKKKRKNIIKMATSFPFAALKLIWFFDDIY